MKVVIAYDGSECAENAIDDLNHAGLADDTEATILTFTETLVLSEDDSSNLEFDWTSAENFKLMRALSREAAMEMVVKSDKFAEEASHRLQQQFPKWTVRHEAIGGFPEHGIVGKANESSADLIVVGSHGRGGVKRFFLGSVSLKVLSEAACAVRIARNSLARPANDDSPLRIMIAVDGSSDSLNAIETVASRKWLPDTEICLVSAVESLPYSVLLAEMPKAEEQREYAANKFKELGLSVSSVVQFGRAKDIILEEAEKWGADSIFIGAKGHRLIERVWLGSVSYAVAAQAHCSVEVVR